MRCEKDYKQIKNEDMGKIIRHRDDVIKSFAKTVHDEATDDASYQQIRDTLMLEVLIDIRDNLHHIAKNLQTEITHEEYVRD